MSLPIEDYALIGDCQTAALVARNGSIDWFCVPRFDGGACFAALLGDADHGRWRIAPRRDVGQDDVVATRSYYDHTLILETVFETASGRVAVIDFMPPGADDVSKIVRIVEGRAGRVTMRSEISLRFNYGVTTPWVTKLPDDTNGVRAIAGPDMVTLRAPVALEGEGMQTVAHFDVAEGQRLAFVLGHSPSHLPLPAALDAEQALRETVTFWEKWGDKPLDAGVYTDIVRRSLMVLKALTYGPTGGIVAAPTTSLPEKIGGVRNWDYRYCWLRDATLTLFALMNAGYYDEARAWRMWLERAVAGDASRLRIMYGLGGEQRLEEWEIDELPGYEQSKPVRIGNAASNQLQLDVYGQVMGALHYARLGGLDDDDAIWPFQLRMLEHLETIWFEPDRGIWETRDGAKQFTFSKVMVWTAFDRAVRSAEKFGLDGPVDKWRALRQLVHDDVCSKGYDKDRNAFVQSYGSQDLDASLLLIPMSGFLPASDPRMAGTVAAIEADLLVDGFVARYSTDRHSDGLPPGEGVFLACSFWLVDNLRLQGRMDDATALFERLLAVTNDVGLLAEEYDPATRRQLGNFPQAFSHVSLINSALGLSRSACMAADAKNDRVGSQVSPAQPREPVF
ncbi:MAG: glycoside hydrolase family 15 protein [Burkholderiaceae bacterium]